MKRDRQHDEEPTADEALEDEHQHGAGDHFIRV